MAIPGGIPVKVFEIIEEHGAFAVAEREGEYARYILVGRKPLIRIDTSELDDQCLPGIGEREASIELAFVFANLLRCISDDAMTDLERVEELCSIMKNVPTLSSALKSLVRRGR